MMLLRLKPTVHRGCSGNPVRDSVSCFGSREGISGIAPGFVLPTRRKPTTETGTDTREGNLPGKRKMQPTETEPVTPAAQAYEALVALTHGDTTENATSFANTLAQTLYQYLEDTLTLSQRSIDAARAVCTHAQISEPVLEELVDLLTKCDYHRFAPVPLSVNERGGIDHPQLRESSTILKTIKTPTMRRREFARRLGSAQRNPALN